MGSLPLSESKKKARAEAAVIVFEDEASFRQTPTLHGTWARRNSQPQIPTRGERNTQKIFGAVRLDNGQSTYFHQEDYFHWESYLAFMDLVLLPAYYRRGHRIYLIQDNASYHKKEETYQWFADHRRYIEVFLLPPYWPELNAAEQLWKYTRQHTTHNRFFETPADLREALFRTFRDMIKHREKVVSLIRSFI